MTWQNRIIVKAVPNFNFPKEMQAVNAKRFYQPSRVNI
jgi:hypothetical protein